MVAVKKRIVFPVVLAALLSACAEPGEFTGVSAATGGVVGAGLGAIVGSQTGDAGAGLVIGAAAGAGAGAAIGNVLDGQDQAIRQQDEAIGRQEQVIRAQRGEIDELRRLGQDSVRFRSKPGYRADLAQPLTHSSTVHSSTVQRARVQNHIASQSAPVVNTGRTYPPLVNPHAPIPAAKGNAPLPLRQVPVASDAQHAAFVARAPSSARFVPKTPDLLPELPSKSDQANDMTGFASLEEVPSQAKVTREELPIVASEPVAPARIAPRSAVPVSTECANAESEFQAAAGKTEVPDKLFHIRRALRLCPDEPRFHSSLADVYKTLGRETDAQFEYQEAQRLASSSAAKEKY